MTLVVVGQPVGHASWNGQTAGGVTGWLRLAGGDNTIGMIQKDLVESEQSVVRVLANGS